jgi:hypothetical protein
VANRHVFVLVVRRHEVMLNYRRRGTMHTSTNEQEATALLHAAERSLFDATSRLEQALAALGRGPGAEAVTLLEQVRLYSTLIQARLDRLARPATSNAA